MSRLLLLLALASCARKPVNRACLTARLPESPPAITCDNGVDVERENHAALSELTRAPTCHRGTPYDVIIVPGYVPLDQLQARGGVHPVGFERVFRAVIEWRRQTAPLILFSGGNVHPEGTPFNEALEMKKAALAFGVPERAILVEPCARHSHTNLRNAGRMMVALGLPKGLVVTSYEQGVYFKGGAGTSFTTRARVDLGYAVGDIRGDNPLRLAFFPSPKVMREGPDPFDP